MRVLLAAAAEKPHFLGMVPLAWALRAAGHEVRVASQPALEPVAVGAGLPFTAVGRDHSFWRTMKVFDLHDTLDDVPLFGRVTDPYERVPWEYLLEGYRRVVPWWWRMVNDPMVDDLVALCRDWRPDLVVWGSVSFSGAIAAEACGAAHVRYLWGADIFARTRARFLARMGEQPASRREDPLAEWLGARAARYGVDFSETLVHGQATVEQVPASLRVDTPAHLEYLPVRYVPYNGRAVVPDWLRTPPDRPRVCVTLGTTLMGQDRGGDVFRDLLEGLAGLDVEVVATLPAREQEKLGAVPGNARLVEYVPLHALAPTCAAMVDHGGWGTVLTGLDAGVPQVIVPSWFDDPMLADMLAARDAAVAVPQRTMTAGDVSEAVSRLMEDPLLARGTARVHDEMLAMPSPSDLADALVRRARG
ncbi:activator-dependent family glycosyltransferase [Nocardiopsis sp. HUAS JQ3]|uniref:activator-dependent family glycosyltransferase n=1 Tax=Nocardiopsis sp. HUAS JQ3 TaxID=3061629 RepID=UPI0023A9CBBB|nr:activator-dependent family glycosyltransferase [Nocardiopsis sp. HUAS JQ3]WDZ90837.1 activator-dependent family glycosyltransferase [Nocardiopsis sp. HUAS JQ3]